MYSGVSNKKGVLILLIKDNDVHETEKGRVARCSSHSCSVGDSRSYVGSASKPDFYVTRAASSRVSAHSSVQGWSAMSSAVLRRGNKSDAKILSLRVVQQRGPN